MCEDKIVQKDAVLSQLLRPLIPALEEEGVTELTINQPGEIWVKQLGEWVQYKMPMLTISYLHSLITSIIVYNGLESKSVISGELPGGRRVQIVKPPACISGTVSISIRNHLSVIKTLEELTSEGVLDEWKDVSFNQDLSQSKPLDDTEKELLKLKGERNLKAFLEKAVFNYKNIIISGKTGSGKTTFTRALIEKVPAQERLITIEDTHELFLDNHPNRVHLLYGKNAGRITADQCLASCMRQSPDRIFLAELRGEEALEYLESLNTGHPGSITTTHANNAIQTFNRVLNLVQKSPNAKTLSTDAILQMIYSTLDIVLFLKDRKVMEVFYDPIFAKGSQNYAIK